MKRILTVLTVFLLLFSVCSFSLEGEFLSTWNKAVRKFSGLRNFESGISVKMHLTDDKGVFFDDEYSMKIWIRDLRDYRIDFYAPLFISDISLVFRYSENLLYVINKESKEYSIQLFDNTHTEDTESVNASGTFDDFTVNPADTLFKALDFLVSLDQNPFVRMEAYEDEQSGFFNYVLKINQPSGFSLLFIKEYPLLTIEINDRFEINSIVMTNEKTGETFSIFLDGLMLNVSRDEIDEAFEVSYDNFDLVDYFGKQ